MDYPPPPPPTYQEAMAEKVREASEEQREATRMMECKSVTFNSKSTTVNYTTGKTDLAAQDWNRLTREERRIKKEQERIVFTGAMSSRVMNRTDACVLASMTASLLAIPLIPLYCTWSYLKRTKWQAYLTNKGLHYTKKAYKPAFLSLQDIQHVCLESERGTCVIVTTGEGETVKVRYASNAAELVRAVRTEKGWCQPRILTK